MLKSIKSQCIKNQPLKLHALLNENFMATFEVDTGSYVSTLKAKDVRNAGISVVPTTEKAVAYGGTSIDLIGECILPIKLGQVVFQHRFLVVNENEVNLFGRDLCSKFDLKISIPSEINNVNNNVLSKYADYLSDDFKSCVTDTVSLSLSSDSCKPVFSKSRSVPISMKPQVVDELNRLTDEGIITKVFRSDYASPTVNIVKKSGSLRICGDYSATVNQNLDPVSYPLPSIDDVISDLSNAKIFSKLDLQNAYSQLPLDENSKCFTTISTVCGLYQYNYLPYGLTSSPGIFMSFISKILNGVDNIIIYQDDILVHSSDVSSHNKVLDTVLSTLKNAGIKLNNKKCEFFVDQMEYLSHIFFVAQLNFAGH